MAAVATAPNIVRFKSKYPTTDAMYAPPPGVASLHLSGTQYSRYFARILRNCSSDASQR